MLEPLTIIIPAGAREAWADIKFPAPFSPRIVTVGASVPVRVTAGMSVFGEPEEHERSFDEVFDPRQSGGAPRSIHLPTRPWWPARISVELLKGPELKPVPVSLDFED